MGESALALLIGQDPFFTDGALDAALRQLYADPKYAGADYGYLLNKAAESVNAAIGVTTPPASAAAPATPKTAPKQTPAATAATSTSPSTCTSRRFASRAARGAAARN